jgi:hypothetical protein
VVKISCLQGSENSKAINLFLNLKVGSSVSAKVALRDQNGRPCFACAR